MEPPKDTAGPGSDFLQALNSIALAIQANNPTSFVWQPWTSTLTGFSGTPTQANEFIVIGKTVILKYDISGTSNATTFNMTVPVVAKAGNYETSTGLATDNSTTQGVPARAFMLDASTIQFGRTAGTLGWTAAGTKGARGIHIYQAA